MEQRSDALVTVAQGWLNATLVWATLGTAIATGTWAALLRQAGSARR
jgi:hypothetical protein